jgi:hypothetical protein
MDTQAKTPSISQLLRRGDMTAIGQKLGLSRQAVSLALAEGRPGHPAVIEAMRMARESGALEAAQGMATLQPVA